MTDETLGPIMDAGDDPSMQFSKKPYFALDGRKKTRFEITKTDPNSTDSADEMTPKFFIDVSPSEILITGTLEISSIEGLAKLARVLSQAWAERERLVVAINNDLMKNAAGH